MIPGLNIINGKASIASINGARRPGAVQSPSSGILGGFEALKSI